MAILDPFFRLLAGITFIAGGLGTSGALAAFAVGNVVAFAIAMLPLRTSLKRIRDDGARFGSLDRYTLFSLIANVSLMTLGSIDQIAVKHYFSEEVAGNYAVAFLLGRIILNTTIALSWVVFARSATMKQDDSKRSRFLVHWMMVIGGLAVAPTLVYVAAPDLAVVVFGGVQYNTAVSYVGMVGLEMTLFSLVYIQAFYLMSIKRMALVWPLILGIALEIVVLALFHTSVQQILFGLIGVLAGLLIWISILSRQSLLSGNSQIGAMDRQLFWTDNSSILK